MKIMAGKKIQTLLPTFFLAVIYAGLFYAVQFFFFKSAFVPNGLTEGALDSWDAGVYHSVARGGYYCSNDFINTNSACYLLFPLVWKIAQVGVTGMCILNIFFFALGFSILCSLYDISLQNKIMWLTIPTVYYTFIPYSEALFFLLCSLTLYGIKKDNNRIVWISLFLLSLTRATGIFLAPALLAMSILSYPKSELRRNLIKYLKFYLSPIVAGTAAFIVYQYEQTGIWFVYFITQKISEGHSLKWPTLPFQTMSGPPLIWISALAMFIDVVAFIFLGILLVKWLIKNKTEDPLMIVSCGYLFVVMVQIVSFNPTWGPRETTNVLGIFRYTMANPFFYVFLYRFTNAVQYTWKNYVLVFIVSNVVWLTFGSYVHIDYFLYFMGNTLLIFVYMLHSNKKLQWPVLMLAVLNFYFQVCLFQMFIAHSSFPE